MVDVEINTLEKIFGLLIQKLKGEGASTIHIRDDLYNKIPTQDWDVTNMNVEESITISSIVDDYDNLMKLVLEGERPCMYLDFDRMASVLRAISQTQNPI